MTKIAKISRMRIYPRPARQGFAWNYVYTVDYGEHLEAAGSQYATFESLYQAVAACKRHGYKVEKPKW